MSWDLPGYGWLHQDCLNSPAFKSSLCSECLAQSGERTVQAAAREPGHRGARCTLRVRVQDQWGRHVDASAVRRPSAWLLVAYLYALLHTCAPRDSHTAQQRTPMRPARDHALSIAGRACDLSRVVNG